MSDTPEQQEMIGGKPRYKVEQHEDDPTKYSVFDRKHRWMGVAQRCGCGTAEKIKAAIADWTANGNPGDKAYTEPDGFIARGWAWVMPDGSWETHGYTAKQKLKVHALATGPIHWTVGQKTFTDVDEVVRHVEAMIRSGERNVYAKRFGPDFPGSASSSHDREDTTTSEG